MELYPLFILALGIAIVMGLILRLRVNAFIALIVAAFAISLMAPGEMDVKIGRVATAFGSVAGSIGIVIAMAAIIGKAMMDSGAAERIVQTILRSVGEQRAPFALMASGYTLAIPVFFDTVFYLLIPLARSLWLKARKNYLHFVLAIVAGAAVMHSMVPPTPGPIFMASAFNVDFGLLLLVGGVIGIPMAFVGLAVGGWLNRKYPIDMRPYPGEELETTSTEERVLPPFGVSILPIALPVLLISLNTVLASVAGPAESRTASMHALVGWSAVFGNPNFALTLSAAIALFMVARYRNRSLKELASDTEHALMGGGVIILITAAGGAFGAMLREAGIQQPIQAMMGDSGAGGIGVLVSAALVASLIKFAQGSGTVSMITTSSMFAAMGFSAATLDFNPVYLACVIGAGSLIGDWMNNSGFWIFAKMGGFTTEESLRTWTVLTAAIGLTGVIVSILMALVLPLK